MSNQELVSLHVLDGQPDWPCWRFMTRDRAGQTAELTRSPSGTPQVPNSACQASTFRCPSPAKQQSQGAVREAPRANWAPGQRTVAKYWWVSSIVAKLPCRAWHFSWYHRRTGCHLMLFLLWSLSLLHVRRHLRPTAAAPPCPMPGCCWAAVVPTKKILGGALELSLSQPLRLQHQPALTPESCKCQTPDGHQQQSNLRPLRMARDNACFLLVWMCFRRFRSKEHRLWGVSPETATSSRQTSSLRPCLPSDVMKLVQNSQVGSLDCCFHNEMRIASCWGFAFAHFLTKVFVGICYYWAALTSLKPITMVVVCFPDSRVHICRITLQSPAGRVMWTMNSIMFPMSSQWQSIRYTFSMLMSNPIPAILHLLNP